jgi:hypothetical protein
MPIIPPPDAIPAAPDTEPMTLELFVLRNVPHVNIRLNGKWIRVHQPDMMADLHRLAEALRLEGYNAGFALARESVVRSIEEFGTYPNREREIL